MRVLMCFDGTGLEGQCHDLLEKHTHSDDIVRIYFKGCSNWYTGRSYVFPNLEGVADRITQCFNQNELDLERLQQEFKDAVVIEPYDSQKIERAKKITSIKEMALTGYSRGGISAFLLAKKLHDAKNPIPLRVMANQPVSGNSYIGPGTLASKAMYLNECTNVLSAHIVVGSYAKHFGTTGLFALVSRVHNLFFKQLIPYFSPTTHLEIIESPIQSHLSYFGVTLGYKHLKETLAHHGYINKTPKWQTIHNYFKSMECIYLYNEEEKLEIFGDISRIRIDHQAEATLQDYTRKCLEWYAKHLQLDAEFLWSSINFNQKKAIYSLMTRDKGSHIPPGKKLDMLALILSNKAEGKKFIKIINSSTGVLAHTLTYLYQKRTFQSQSYQDKFQYLYDIKNIYLQRLFELSYDHLSSPNPSVAARDQLQTQLQLNHSLLLNEHTDKHIRPILDQCLTVIENIVWGILTLGGIFAYNALHYKDAFFRKHTETYSQLKIGTETIDRELMTTSKK